MLFLALVRSLAIPRDTYRMGYLRYYIREGHMSMKLSGVPQCKEHCLATKPQAVATVACTTATKICLVAIMFDTPHAGCSLICATQLPTSVVHLGWWLGTLAGRWSATAQVPRKEKPHELHHAHSIWHFMYLGLIRNAVCYRILS